MQVEHRERSSLKYLISESMKITMNDNQTTQKFINSIQLPDYNKKNSILLSSFIVTKVF